MYHERMQKSYRLSCETKTASVLTLPAQRLCGNSGRGAAWGGAPECTAMVRVFSAPVTARAGAVRRGGSAEAAAAARFG